MRACATLDFDALPLCPRMTLIGHRVALHLMVATIEHPYIQLNRMTNRSSGSPIAAAATPLATHVRFAGASAHPAHDPNQQSSIEHPAEAFVRILKRDYVGVNTKSNA